MISGEVLTFAVLILLVVVIAVVGRRFQTVHLPPGTRPSEEKNDRRST
ncbi:MAG TPA: hypothetical protein VGD94_18045 [Vicinamibacterales bacterium]